MEEYNTVIIGSGISGMTALIYLLRAGIDTLIIEGDMPGGQLNRATTIENYPGIPSINGSDLAISIYNQIMEYNPNYLYENVLEVDFDNKIIKCDNKKIMYHNLIIAGGRRSRMLGLENEEKYIGRGISFCASCDGALYKNQDVIVVGGANSALAEAIYLSNICKSVTIIYRKSELRGEEINKDRIDSIDNINIIYNSEVSSYIIEEDRVSGVMLDNGNILKCSCVFLAIGYVPNSDIYDVDKCDGYIIVDNNGMTSRENVYACGDIIKKDLYQLVTSTSEGAIVASSIIHNK